MTEMTREQALAHFGVVGMKWGVRRNSQTGIRPIAQTLNDSKFGQKSISRANAYGKKLDAKIAKKAETTLTDRNKQRAKTTAKVAGATTLVAGAAAAAFIIGQSKGVNLADARNAYKIELGKATISKGVWDLARTHDFGLMDAQMVDFIVKDTFANRV